MDTVTRMSTIGLWTTILKAQVWHFDRHHLGFLEPEVTIFRGQGEGNPKASLVSMVSL